MITPTLPTPESLDAIYPAIRSDAWGIDPDVTFLNHGSFGACPRSVLEDQARLRLQLESNTHRFLIDEAPPLLAQSRAVIAGLLHSPVDDLVFVQSATAGVNAVLRSLAFNPGDEILVLDQAYGACLNVVHNVCRKTGAVPVTAKIRWPGSCPQQVLDAIIEKVNPRTRLAMIEHIISTSGLVLPIEDIVQALNERGVDVLVDGAHAPGQVAVDLEALGAAYYTGNCHKWLCGPKAAAVLYVRPDKQHGIEPAIISHGSRQDSSGIVTGDFQERFAWQGTCDPTPAICAGCAIAFLESLMPGGLPELMKRNHEMAVGLRRLICQAWDIEEPCADDMIGSMAALPVPNWTPVLSKQELEHKLRYIDRIECQPQPVGNPPVMHVRLSCHAYNHGGEVLRVIHAFAREADEAKSTRRNRRNDKN